MAVPNIFVPLRKITTYLFKFTNMTKFTLKTFILLCALIAWSPYVWATETTVELTATNLSLIKGGYPDGEQTVEVDNITYKYNNLRKNDDNQIMVKANSGNIYNSTPFPQIIKSVIITHIPQAHSTTVWGSTDGTNWNEVATGNGSINADFSSYSYKYFKITIGENVACWAKIEITYDVDIPSSATSFTNKTPSINFPSETNYAQTPATADGYTGSITYELTNNTAGATIDEEGTVTVSQEGSVTVTATAAAVEGEWQSSSDSYTLTVTDTRTEAPISFFSTTAEAMMGENFEEPTLTNDENLDVTYSSDNENVATVNPSTGAVTLVAAGTANIIATFSGNNTYKHTTAQYELTVHKGAQALPYEESFNKTFGEFTSDNAEATENIYVWYAVQSADYARATSDVSGSFHAAESWLTSPIINTKDATYIALSFEQSIDRYFGTISDEAMVYAKKAGDDDWTKLSITYPATPKEGSSDFITTTVDLSQFAGNNIQIAFVYKGTTAKAGTWKIKNLKIAKSAEDITVTDIGLATFASDKALDFTNVDNLEAYIAKEEGDKITLKQVNIVPENTGVLLRAKDNATDFVVPYATATPDDVTNNIFHRGTGAAVETGSGPYNWILSTKGGVAGFYHANGNTVATNHAYLQTSTANARIDLTFGEETAISNVKSQTPEEDGEVYDLQGRRVVHPTRGLYLVNGEKAIIK